VPEEWFVPPPSPAAISSGATASMLHNQDLADCTLVLGGERMPVHWFVLYTQSEYWKAMFRAGMQEARQMEVEVKEVQPAIMRDVVRFLYTGEIALSEDNAQAVLMAAVRYQIRTLTQVAESFISRAICTENALSVLRLASEHGCSRLKRACLAFLLRNLPEMIAREGSEAPDEQTVEGILSMLADKLADPGAAADVPSPQTKRARTS
jgi:hypothetical protein